MEHGAGSEEEGNCAGERNPEVRGQKSEVREWQRASAFAGGVARLRGIMSKIVKGVVETRSLKCMRLRRGYRLSVLCYRGGGIRLRQAVSAKATARQELRRGRAGSEKRPRGGYQLSVLGYQVEKSGASITTDHSRAGDLYEPEADQRIPVLMKFAVNFSDSGVSNLK